MSRKMIVETSYVDDLIARIKALEAALREIAERTTDDDLWEIHRITRAALAPEPEQEK